MKQLSILVPLVLLLLGMASCTIQEFPEATCYSDGDLRAFALCCNPVDGNASCAQALEQRGVVPAVAALYTECVDIGGGGGVCEEKGVLGEDFECLSSRDCSAGELCTRADLALCQEKGLSTNVSGSSGTCALCLPACDAAVCGACATGDGIASETTEGCQ